MQQYKTWVEVKKKALAHNIATIIALVNQKTAFFAVVKSNAYGHGLLTISKELQAFGKQVKGFCVDSVLEGLKLRQNGLKKPILVLGPTLTSELRKGAQKEGITVTVSTMEGLHNILKSKDKPAFHIKLDTGMHRQGFHYNDLPKLIQTIKKKNAQSLVTGLYTHFASAKDITYPTYTHQQAALFKKAIDRFKRAGFKNTITHASATGGTLLFSKYHFDAVRIGIGMYGLWPSKELQIQRPEIKLQPVLSWHALVSEVKKLKKGDYIGYDLTERLVKPATVAIIPIGYWHGFPRALSNTGYVLIKGKRAKVLGRVSMDLIVVNVSAIPCRVGDRATLIGKQGSEEITAEEFSQRAGTSNYEVVTRINPLIERIII